MTATDYLNDGIYDVISGLSQDAKRQVDMMAADKIEAVRHVTLLLCKANPYQPYYPFLRSTLLEYLGGGSGPK